jgi:hypothetical protein
MEATFHQEFARAAGGSSQHGSDGAIPIVPVHSWIVALCSAGLRCSSSHAAFGL